MRSERAGQCTGAPGLQLCPLSFLHLNLVNAVGLTAVLVSRRGWFV